MHDDAENRSIDFTAFKSKESLLGRVTGREGGLILLDTIAFERTKEKFSMVFGYESKNLSLFKALSHFLAYSPSV